MGYFDVHAIERRVARFMGKRPLLWRAVIVVVLVGVGVALYAWQSLASSQDPAVVWITTFVSIGILTFLLGTVLARAIRVEFLVIQRSAALMERNDHLKKEIAERVRLEGELRWRTSELAANDERYQLVVEQTGQIVYEYSGANEHRLCSGAVRSILGYTPAEFSAWDTNITESLIHPEDRPHILPELRRTRRQPGPFALAYRLRRKNHTYAHVLDRGVSLADERGKVRRTVGILADMSDIQRLEENTRRHLRFLETLLNMIPSPVFYIDAAGKYRHCNRAHAQEVLGMPLDQIVGKTISELAPAIPAHLGQLYQRRNHELLEQGGIQRYEVPVACADGVQREFFATKTVFYGESGEPEGIIGVMADITERRQSEQAVALNQRQLSHAMDLARLAHWRHDLKREMFTFNDRFYALHGTSMEQEGGYEMSTAAYIQNFLFPEDGHLIADGIAHARASKNSEVVFQGEHRVRRRDGKMGYVIVRVEMTKDASGQIVDVNGTTQDITLRRKQEEELKKLWTAIEQSPAIVVMTDANGQIEYVNRRFEESTGFTAAEVRGKTPNLWKSGHHAATFYAELWQTIRGGRQWRGEFCNQRKDGTRFWEAASISPVRDRAGEITHFIAVKEDITLRKKVADELKRTEEALRQQAAFLRSVTGTTPYAIYVADSRVDQVLYFNARFIEIWGLQEIQDRLARGAVKHSELLARFVDATADPQTFIEHAKPLQQTDYRAVAEADVLLRDGRILHHLSMQVRDEQDTFLGRLCLLEDVTAQKQAAQQLSASLKQKEILLREVYHRVKNNLQVISSLLNLQSSAIKDTQTIRLIRETQDRVRSMALVHEKLYRADDLSRINFAEYTQQLVSMLARSYRTHGRAVNLRFALQQIHFNLDTSIPCGLILNELVSNALKYAFKNMTDDRPPEIAVELSAAEAGCYVLCVMDNGVGLPAEIDVRHTATLGLQVVSMLADQLSGSLDVERTGGTRFKLTFQEISDRTSDRHSGKEHPGTAQPAPPTGDQSPAAERHAV